MTFTESDLHVHTSISLCAERTADPLKYIEYGAANGLKTIGFANHYWDEDIPGATPWYQLQNTEHIMQIFGQLGDRSRFPIKVLIGCETEYAHGTLGISEKKAEMLDYVLVPHSHTHMNGFVLPDYCNTPEKHADYLVRSFYEVATHRMAKDYITCIVHPFVPVGRSFGEITEILSNIPDERYFECACAAKENDILIEINTDCFLPSVVDDDAFAEYKRFFAQCKRAGCRFCAGSDKHDLVKDKESDPFFAVDGLAEKLGVM